MKMTLDYVCMDLVNKDFFQNIDKYDKKYWYNMSKFFVLYITHASSTTTAV